jgi:hypothetical protein
MTAMFTQDTTPYYSRLIEQNALQRERNEIAASHLSVYKKWVSAEYPGLVLEDVNIYNNLILIYREGVSIWVEVSLERSWTDERFFVNVLQPILKQKVQRIRGLIVEIKTALEVSGTDPDRNPLYHYLKKYLEIFIGSADREPVGILNWTDINDGSQRFAMNLISDFWDTWMKATISSFLDSPTVWGLSE